MGDGYKSVPVKEILNNIDIIFSFEENLWFSEERNRSDLTKSETIYKLRVCVFISESGIQTGFLRWVSGSEFV